MGLKDDYFTVSEAAEEIGVTRQTISRWLKRGKLQAEKVGRERIINKKDLFNVYNDEKLEEMIFKKLFPRMEERIRKEFHYGKGDRIDTMFLDPRLGYYIFIVSRKDGNLDKIKFYTKYEPGKGLKVSKILRDQYIKTREETTK